MVVNPIYDVAWHTQNVFNNLREGNREKEREREMELDFQNESLTFCLEYMQQNQIIRHKDVNLLNIVIFLQTA